MHIHKLHVTHDFICSMRDSQSVAITVFTVYTLNVYVSIDINANLFL